MATLNHTDGFILHGWMVTELHLGGADLLAFALVHQFSQSDAGVYTGGTSYLCAWTGWTPKTARAHLQHLVSLGLITERRGERNGVQFVTYKVAAGVGEKLPGYGKNYRGVGEFLPIDNKEENKEDKSSDRYKGREAFDFAKEIEALGVPAAVVVDWMKVRGAKRADNTRTAYEGIVREIRKSGKTAEECIRFSAEHGWRGFEAAWMEKDDQRRNNRPAAPKQESHMDYYARVMRELHPEEYGGIDNQ